MRTNFRPLIALVALALVLLVPASIRAQGSEAEGGAIVSENLVRFENTVTVTGNVAGDAIVGGNSVTINGTVEGDVLGVASTLTVNGRVKGNVRVAAQALNLNGSVGRNLTAAAETVVFNENAVVGGTVALLAGDVWLHGSIGGNVTVYARNVALAGNLHRSADLHVGRDGTVQRTVGQALLIEGDLSYKAPAQIDLAEGSVGGTVRYTPATDTFGVDFQRALNALRVFWFFGVLLLGLLLGWLIPRLWPAYRDALLGARAGAVLGGFGLLLGVPLVVVLLLLTLIGIPVAALLLTGYGLLASLWRLPIGALIGAEIFQRFGWKRNGTTELIVGFTLTELVLSVLLRALGSAVPVFGPIGGLITLFLMVWVFGATATLLGRALQRAQPSKPKPV